MALPVPESAAGPREDIIRLLAGTPEGLSDAEIAAVLGERYPDLTAKAVNHQCRRLVAAGTVERVGTRPVRTRLLDDVPVVEEHTTPPDVPLEEEPPRPALSPVQASIVRVLREHPDGLTDTGLAAALAGQHPDVDPKAFNYQCRKLAKAGLVERTARSRDVPIRTRLTAAGLEGHTAQPAPAADEPDVPLAQPSAPAAEPTPTEGHTTQAAPAPGEPDVPLAEPSPPAPESTPTQGHTTQPAPAADEPDVPLAEPSPPAPESTPTQGHTAQPAPAPGEPDVPLEEPEPALVGAPSRRPRRRTKAPSDDVARMRRSERDDWAPDDPDEPLLRFLPFAPAAGARTALRERMAERAALRRVPEPTDEVVLPTRDVLQGWSRTQNVAAAVATWLARRGGTIRAASVAGPAHDLVATLDGDDVHVEVTGWPPDGARSHPTTLAGDWFRAATRAASQRRRAHPRSRVVIALPDTRRYRALADDGADVLRDARAEVWFVEPSGDVQLS
ncbi:MarR family winged helix-turn-helix transcriptional regulator [Actinomycetospora sp. TBRC 11914]|uniref:MarR family winged helix-turn-helix transcriptional regulator n=1 Tax=Actinomycetospora sp. TBRC 11914 TaxID=2729387 RepID=UPI00145C4F8F|nr:MarR family winged helix-turn-helix transcriptional regulator [Actinomycetospora sp. TBRC 11914]NMO92004.1 hypothetical protein [Actinomycetospora sp. TBRC 11914]